MVNRYEFLNSLNKDGLISLCVENEKEIQRLQSKLDNIEQEHNKKIKESEDNHKKELYKQWKRHIDTRWLDKYLTEFISNNLSVKMNKGYNENVGVRILLGKKEISSDGVDLYYDE